MTETVQLDQRSMERARDLLYSLKQGSDKAVFRAVNHGTKRGRKLVVDAIYAKAALKKSDIRTFASFYLASLGTNGNAAAKLVLKGGPLNLMDYYGARAAGKQGVSFRIWRDGRREKYRHAFIATLLKARYSGVFEVNVDAPDYQEGEGIPWRRKEGPGIPTLYEQTPGLADKANKAALDAMETELDRQIGLMYRGLL